MLNIRQSVKPSEGSTQEIAARIDLHQAACDPRISDALFLKMIRASYVGRGEMLDACWTPIIDELKLLEKEEA